MKITRARCLASIGLIFLSLSAGSGSAQLVTAPVSISTGREDGNYFYIGQRLQAQMLMEHDYRIGLETSSGSIQNLARLADPSSEIGLALTQTDALSGFLEANSEFSKDFIVLGDAGKECVVLIGARKDGIRSFSELKSIRSGEISVDDPGSGASATFDHLVAMDPKLRGLKPVFVDTLEALLQLKVAGPLTLLKAAMLVQRPSMRSPAVNIVLQNPQHYQLIPILESDVQNAMLPDDRVVYTYEHVTIGSRESKSGLPVDTICTRSLLLASKEKLSRDLRSKLSLLMLNSSKAVIGQGD